MEVSSAKRGFSWGATRELVLPVTFLFCAGLYYGAGQPYWVVLVFAVPALVVYVLAPFWAHRSMLRFDRDAVALLASGRAAQLVGRYERALGLRLFAPPAASAERRAMALAEVGDMPAAHAAYREALDEYGAVAPLRVMLGYAHASFALGDDAAAISMYRQLLATTGSLPGVERHLAHALVRSGDDPTEALALLDRAPRPLPTAADQTGAARDADERTRHAELSLLRAIAHARLGDRAKAAACEADANGVGSETAHALRALLRSVRQGSTLPRA